MLAFFSNFILLADTSHKAAESGGWWAGVKHFEDEWFNIPGFEAWKFINLAIFIALMVYVLKKPLGDAFKAKRDQIRAELIKAEQEKQAALVQLTSAEGKLAQLPTEKETILREAKDEAETEKKRLAEHAEFEAERLRKQSEAELARLAGQTRKELRRLSAEKTVTLAEQKLRASIDGSIDARLVKGSLSEIGGLN